MSQPLSRFVNSIPSVTRHLIFINLLIWLFTAVAGGPIANRVNDLFALHYFGADDFMLYQLVTYMFLHAGFAHFFFNMFTLFMFGRPMEITFGAKRFLTYYLVCGIGAALVQEFVWWISWQETWAELLAQANHVDIYTMRDLIHQALANGDSLPFLNQMITVGASGAIFGVLLAFGMIYPNLPTYLFFIPVPIKAKWMVLGYGLIELYLGVSQTGSSIAHFAHLGGMIFGLLLILYWKKNGDIHRIY